MDEDEDGYLLGEGAARKIGALIKRFSSPGGGVGRGKNATMVPFQRLGITTSAIAPRAGKTPGAGTVDPYYDNGTELVMDDNLGSQTIKNWTGTTVPTGVWVKFTIIDGFLYLDGTDCSGVAP